MLITGRLIILTRGIFSLASCLVLFVDVHVVCVNIFLVLVAVHFYAHNHVPRHVHIHFFVSQLRLEYKNLRKW